MMTHFFNPCILSLQFLVPFQHLGFLWDNIHSSMLNNVNNGNKCSTVHLLLYQYNALWLHRYSNIGTWTPAVFRWRRKSCKAQTRMSHRRRNWPPDQRSKRDLWNFL